MSRIADEVKKRERGNLKCESLGNVLFLLNTYVLFVVCRGWLIPFSGAGKGGGISCEGGSIGSEREVTGNW